METRLHAGDLAEGEQLPSQEQQWSFLPNHGLFEAPQARVLTLLSSRPQQWHSLGVVKVQGCPWPG